MLKLTAMVAEGFQCGPVDIGQQLLFGIKRPDKTPIDVFLRAVKVMHGEYSSSCGALSVCNHN